MLYIAASIFEWTFRDFLVFQYFPVHLVGGITFVHQPNPFPTSLRNLTTETNSLLSLFLIAVDWYNVTFWFLSWWIINYNILQQGFFHQKQRWHSAPRLLQGKSKVSLSKCQQCRISDYWKDRERFQEVLPVMNCVLDIQRVWNIQTAVARY